MTTQQHTYNATILGGIWWPTGAICSTERTFRASNDEEAIEAAQTTEAGDFASCGHRHPVLVKDWDNEDNEMAYFDTVSEGEE